MKTKTVPAPTGYVAPVTREEYENLKSKTESLYDSLKNGIEYDEEQNIFYLVWTEKEINDAREEAKKLCAELGWKDPSPAFTDVCE